MGRFRGGARASAGLACGYAAGAAGLLLALDPRPHLEDQRRADDPIRPAFAVVDFALSQLRREHRVLVLGSTALLPHMALHWEAITRGRGVDEVFDALEFPGAKQWDDRYRRGYPEEMTPEYAPILDRSLRSSTYDRVVTLAIPPGSAFCPDWLRRWDAWGQNFTLLMARQSTYRLVADRAFPEADVRVRVYSRP
jgi:hypothetical protein